MSKRRHRRIPGVIPQLARGLLAFGRWLVRHPQPFITAGLLAGAAWLLWLHAQRDEVFRIARITLPAQSAFTAPNSLIGANIWTVDLDEVAGQLQRQAPWFKTVRVIRQLPDTLQVEAIARSPIAQVRLNAWYPVDREGFIMPEGHDAPPTGLVQLLGADTPKVPLRAGQPNASERLQLALRVLDTVRHSRAGAARRVNAIDVSDPNQISLLLEDGTEVRCGAEDQLGIQLGRLRSALEQLARRQVDVRYIDVRFQDPVVSPRT